MKGNMLMNAVMYGGGNIGRGFIGTLFSTSGYTTTFIDIVDTTVDRLNRDGEYPVRIISGDEHEDITVQNVCAVNGKDVDAVATAIANADIMATAVGVNVLKFIIPNIVAGLRKRMQFGDRPLNILICENLMDANKVIEQMIKEQLLSDEIAWFDKNVGLIEASIGRMVPVQTDEMKDGDPLRVCVERYGFLPVDKAAFKGEIPTIQNMIPFEPFDFYIKRKLYVHNMGHATCAYLGDMLGLEYIYQSIDKDEIYVIVRNAMQESARALSKHYNVPLDDILMHIDDLLLRFTNAALKDTCKRVGGDPRRKLSPADRMIGAARLALENGVTPYYITVGAAAALVRFINEAEEMSQGLASASKVLAEVSGIDVNGELAQMILKNYLHFINGNSISDIRRTIDAVKVKNSGQVI